MHPLTRWTPLRDNVLNLESKTTFSAVKQVSNQRGFGFHNCLVKPIKQVLMCRNSVRASTVIFLGVSLTEKKPVLDQHETLSGIRGELGRRQTKIADIDKP